MLNVPAAALFCNPLFFNVGVNFEFPPTLKKIGCKQKRAAATTFCLGTLND